MRFNDVVDSYLKKNSDVLDIPKNSLCPYLFSFKEGTPPVLLESVRLQLLSDLERVAPYVKILKYYLTGESLVPRSDVDSKSDVAIAIEFANYNDDVTSQYRAYSMCKKLSDKYIDRTQHKVYYYLYEGSLNLRDMSGAYDFLNNRWIKVPAFDDEEHNSNNRIGSV